MSSTKHQQLLSLKEENLKFKENFDKFLKKHDANKKYISKNLVSDFVEEQKFLMDSINQQIDEIIAKDQISAQILPQKRKSCDNLILGGKYKSNKIHCKESVKVKINQEFDKNIAKDQSKQIASSSMFIEETIRASKIAGMFIEEKIRATKKSHKEVDQVKNHLEILIENPGLKHLAENIFLHLNYKDLISFQIINRSSKVFLDNSRFWLKKLVQRGLSKQNEIKWIDAIQITKNTDFERNISFYLRRSVKKEKLKDLPCFIDKSTLEVASASSKINYYKPKGHTPGCIQLMAANVENDLTNINPALMMRNAVEDGHFRFIKAIIPLLDKPNALGVPPFETLSDEMDWKFFSPISRAAKEGHLEIIKFLIPFSDNINVTTIQYTIDIAMLFDHDHVKRYLESLIMNTQ